MSTPWHRWNSPAKIFTAGISWNPLEPLPFELQNNNHITTGEHTNGGFPYFPGHDAGTAHTGGPLPVPATLSIANPIKSATTGPVVGPNGKGTGFPSFTVQEPGRNVLPPLSVTVDASIVQDTAKVAVTQLFWNDSDVPIKEAAFTFPLPAGCTVTDFSCRIGINKIIKGTVKPRQEARDQFRHHIRDHNTAAGLLEQDTPEIFTTTLGNVPKWTKVKINLIYITVLKHRFASSRSTTTLILPTSIAPRYGEAPEEYSDAKATDVSRGLTVEIEIVESERITSISSPSHAIAVQRQQGSRTAKSFADLAGEDGKSCVTVETASVKLEKGPLFLDKDFVLDIVTDPNGDNENPQAWLEQHPTLSNHKTLMLTLPPGYLNRSAAPMQRSEILFLADRSGSMEDKIPALKSAMQFFLKGIPEHRKFNIWSFGSHYTSWQPASVDYTEETLSSALSYVETNIRADMGGTELLPAIEATIEKRDRTMMTDVIILTDGEVWRLEESLEYVQKTRHRTEGQVRFFSLGIGNMVSHALVDGIAMTGGGYSEVVQEASQGGWEDRVVSMTKAALLSAHLGPTHLSFDIQDENGRTRSSTLAEAKRSPADTSTVNPFDRSRIYFHLDCLGESESIKSVKVELQTTDDSKTLVIPVTVLERQDATIHKLAARAMLDDLERGCSHIHLGPNRLVPNSWQETSMVRKEAEKIACKWSLVSKWTSFFLAEEPYRPTGGDPFMDGIVEVEASPGEDLLEPRGNIQHIAVLEPASVISDPYMNLAVGNAAPPTTGPGSMFEEVFTEAPTDWLGAPQRAPSTHCRLGERIDTEPESPTDDSYSLGIIPGGPSMSFQDISDNLPLRDVDLPKRGSGRIFTPIFEVASTETYKRTLDSATSVSRPKARVDSPFKSTVGSEEALPNYNQLTPSPRLWGEGNKRTEGDFVRELLAVQQYDGAIDFGDWPAAGKVLGEAVSDALRALQQTHLDFSDKAVWTAAAHVLLERDLQSYKALWELMAIKMAEHCAKLGLSSVPTSNLLDLVRGKLKGLRLPFQAHEKNGEVSPLDAQEAPAAAAVDL